MFDLQHCQHLCTGQHLCFHHITFLNCCHQHNPINIHYKHLPPAHLTSCWGSHSFSPAILPLHSPWPSLILSCLYSFLSTATGLRYYLPGAKTQFLAFCLLISLSGTWHHSSGPWHHSMVIHKGPWTLDPLQFLHVLVSISVTVDCCCIRC